MTVRHFVKTCVVMNDPAMRILLDAADAAQSALNFKYETPRYDDRR